jgi:hypothetical protein
VYKPFRGAHEDHLRPQTLPNTEARESTRQVHVPRQHINLSVFRRRQITLPFAQQCFYPDQKNAADLTHHVRQASPMLRSFIRWPVRQIARCRRRRRGDAGHKIPLISNNIGRSTGKRYASHHRNYEAAGTSYLILSGTPSVVIKAR